MKRKRRKELSKRNERKREYDTKEIIERGVRESYNTRNRYKGERKKKKREEESRGET